MADRSQGATMLLDGPQIRVLERIAAGAALGETLDAIVRLVEAHGDIGLCSVLLLEEGRLRHGAAPSLPPEYVRGIDGARIGPEEGSCGAAALYGRRVVAEDILTHPNWKAYRELASAHGLRACWSSPIFSPEREVLGTFAIYHREPHAPSAEDLAVVDVATHVAAIAIAADRTRRAQRSAEERVQKLARLYAVSSAVNEALLRVSEPAVLYASACRIAVERGLATLAWIGFYDADADLVHPVASFGEEAADYVKAVKLRLRDPSIRLGPAAEALRGRVPAVSNDIATDPNFHWGEEAARRGLRSCAVFPLLVAGRPPGLFAIYGATPDFFHEEEITVLQMLAGNIAFAVESARAEEEKTRLVSTLLEREDRLRQSEAELRVASQMAKIGGFSVELPGRYVSWSEQLYAMHEMALGTPPTAAHALDSCAPEFLETAKRMTEACIRDGTPFDTEVQLITAKGKRVWIRALGRAERDASGKIVRIRGALQDVDERHRLEDQLRQSQKMDAIGQLAGSVAHDFNNHLSVILSYASYILDGLAAGSPLRPDLEEIRRAGTRATELTRRLLTFSRQQALVPRLVDLSEVLGGVGPMLRRLVGEHVSLIMTPGEGLGRVLLDPNQVEQVIMNLAVNARDAMPAGGTLTLETSAVTLDAVHAAASPGVNPGDFIVIRVTDTGHGMDAATRARIFEPFFTTKPKGRGTGIGLATVYGIVAQSGGHISVESEPGRGTTFKVYFPRRSGAASSTSPRATTSGRPTRRGTETVLLVEDDEHVRGAVSAMLRRAGYSVLEAGGGGDAVVISEKHSGRIHLLVTDVVMPRMSGPELARRLGATRPEMQVIFMSGYAPDELVHHGVPAEAHGVLPKPVTPDALLGKIAETLEGMPVASDLKARTLRPAATRGERILHVDDEEALVQLTSRFLERLGYRVTGFTDPEAALRAFETQPDAFDAVITDVSMARMSGFDLVRAVRRKRPDVPIVVMSGYFRAEDLKEAAALGLGALVVKPDTVDELGQVLHDEIQSTTKARADALAP